MHYINVDKQHIGFIPDAYRLLQKYDLTNVLDIFIDTGCFPSKHVWKGLLQNNLIIKNKTETIQELYLNNGHAVISTLIKLDNHCIIWSIMQDNPGLRSLCHKAMDIIGRLVSRQFTERCNKCTGLTENIVEHKLFHCVPNEGRRSELWSKLYEIDGSELFAKSAHEQCWRIIEIATDSADCNLKHVRLLKLVVDLFI